MLTPKEILKKRKLFSESDRYRAATFKALGDVSRFRIFRILAHRPEISVSTLAKILHVSVPLTSQHIKVLERDGLLTKTRTGKQILCSLDRETPLVRALIPVMKRTVPSRPRPHM